MDFILHFFTTILSFITGYLSEDVLMTITIDFAQLASLVGGAVVIICSFLVWYGMTVSNATKKWGDATTAIENTQNEIAKIAATIESIETDRANYKAELQSIKTEITYMQTQFMQRIEILETLKRTEQFFGNILLKLQIVVGQRIDIDVPDLQSPVLQRQQHMEDQMRRAKA